MGGSRIGDTMSGMKEGSIPPTRLLKQLTLACSWVTRVDEVFEACGFVDVKVEQYPILKELYGYQMDLASDNRGSIGMDRMIGEGAGDNVRARLAAAYEEHRLYGSAVEADMVVCIGRKVG